MRFDSTSPLIGIPACTRGIDDVPFQLVGEKYIAAVAQGAGGLPLLIPALGEMLDVDDLVRRLDGLLVTGSPSNVAAHLYDGPPDRPDSPQDPARDATTLPLIRAALAAGLPMLCICRGLQELNVALGGDLHQQVHALPGRIDHRSPRGVPFDERYGLRHPVTLSPGGHLSRILGKQAIVVNSLHWQSIARLADGLAIEAVASDGVIEAVGVRDAKNFALGVQWHPEFRVLENPDSQAIFADFGTAARARAASRAGRGDRAA